VPQDQENRSREQRFSVADHAHALAVVLQEEFGVPFAFFNSVSGEPVRDEDPKSKQSACITLQPAEVLKLTAEGRARVAPLDRARYQLSLLLYRVQEPILLAVAETAALAEPRAAGVVQREQAMWRGWLQAVSDRLRLADQLLSRRRAEETHGQHSQNAWEALLGIDQAARRLSLHRDPAESQQHILEMARHVLRAKTLLWAPAQRGQPVLIEGEACLKPEQCLHLAEVLGQFPDFRPPAPLLCNQVGSTPLGPRFPQIANLVAFQITEREPLGWLIALNKEDGTAFRRSDGALLLPFAGLCELHLRWSHRHHDLRDLLVGLTRSLTTALDAKDPYTFGHSERVARIAVEVGRELGIDGDGLSDLYLAGLLHDVGKIGIKDSVLRKQGPLTREEQEHIQEHVTIGYWILAELRQIRNLLPGVLYHHERYDGKGYPDGLAAEQIPMLARILSVADAYDAMSHQRPYRDAMPYRRVEEILTQGAGTQWDKEVVEAFFRCSDRVHAIRQRGVGDSLRQAIEGALRNESFQMHRPPRITGWSDANSPAVCRLNGK
jgi:HD-GYP domain-containing protein (c-di-GMP phosphodiesterase class II)